MAKSIWKVVRIIVITLLFVSILVGIPISVIYYIKTHFLAETEIGGVTCEFLTEEEAIEKINLEKGQQTVTFEFSNGKIYEASLSQFDIRINEQYITQIFEKQHLDYNEARKYDTDGFFSVDTKKIKSFLKSIPELQEKNMVQPQNAYIEWNEEKFAIQEEILGSVIDFKEAFDLALKSIEKDEEQVNFMNITDIMPSVLKKDLQSELSELNSILNSSITFELSDGSTVTLGHDTIKSWIYQEENGKYAFDIENGVSEFVKELATAVDIANSSMQFPATNLEKPVTISIPIETRAQVDIEKEIAEIKNLLGNSEALCVKPIYDRELLSEMLENYIEIDLSRQSVWAYTNGELLVETQCVTGNVQEGYNTPTGIFFLIEKARNVDLKGYNKDGSMYSSFVNYWMRFYRGYGLHDALWRSNFGGNIYLTNGSHGCINLPFDKATQIYEVIDNTMPIIIYKSQS